MIHLGRWAKFSVLLGPIVAFGLVVSPQTAHADITGVGGILEPSRSLSGSYLAGRLAVDLNDQTAAAEYFREALRLDPDNRYLLSSTFSLELVTGNVAEAHDLAIRLVEIDPGHWFARLLLGVEAFRARQFADARRQFSEIDAPPISDAVTGLLVAWSHVGSGDIDTALATVSAIDIGQAVDLEPIKIYQSALINDVAGNLDEAERLMQLLDAGEHRDLRGVQALTRYAMLRGDQERAEALVEGLPSQILRHSIGEAIATAVRGGVAPDPIATNAREGAVEALLGIGRSIAASGQAPLFYQLALAIQPDAAWPLIHVGEHFDAIEDYAAAIAAYERVSEDSSLRDDADIKRAEALNNLDRFEEARALLMELEDYNPDNRNIAFTLALMLHNKDRWAEAAIHYSRAIEATPVITEADWLLFFYRGIAYERNKQWPKAEADFQRALELDPEQPNVLNYLGYSWIDQGVNLDEALALVEKAVELRPNDGDIIDSLGWAYFRLGRYEEAVYVLEKAVVIRAEEPVIQDHLGDAYWMVGRKLEARFQWQHALDLEPDEELAETIRDKLRNGLGDAAEVELDQDNGG
ncbi:MAG: tetratricopeptide repeat protein [Pseudomonadota bacterium]